MRRRLVPPPSWPRVVGAWALLLPGVVAFQPTFGGPAGYLASGFATALVQIGIMDLVRFILTGTWSGFFSS